MRLADLLPEVDLSRALSALPIRGAQSDSRRVEAGDVFFAVAGLTHDGAEFVEQAACRGAVAVVAERRLSSRIPCVVVESVPRVFGKAMAVLYGQPADRLSLVGITGTNGKTTTAFLLEAMLACQGRACGLIGTIATRYPGFQAPAQLTTPDAAALQATLAQMASADCSHVVMEVSSHALHFGRVWGCRFAVAAFSHISQDHLDLHGDMQSYLACKLRLFRDHLDCGGSAVVNIDGAGADAVRKALTQRGHASLISCSAEDPGASVWLHSVRSSRAGLELVLRIAGRDFPLSTPLVGEFNAHNIALAAGCALALGLDLPAALPAVGHVVVPGRLEAVSAVSSAEASCRSPSVFVDFAHTPDALRRALAVLRELVDPGGQLIVLFGCGGDRDASKRSQMGAVAAEGADVVIVSSDNPRSEDPQLIIDAVLEGVRAKGMRPAVDGGQGSGFVVEADRAKAIAAAIEMAQPQDIVLIAGKGHEGYQIIGESRQPFDDKVEALAALRRRSRGV